MQYALVDGLRQEPASGSKGQCPTCGSDMIAKCGPRIVHHWAHAGRRNCDPWWENETPWHREWKSLFPESWREISHTAADGEVHRADIKTPSGIVVEVQHSAITDQERLAREMFYGNLVWVIDGRGFRQNFDIYHRLPAPTSDVAQDIVWVKAKRHMPGANAGLFFRLSDCPSRPSGESKASVRSGLIHSIREIEAALKQYYAGHHQFDWVRPRRTWLEATRPVYVDLGPDLLVRLEIYDESGLQCIRLIDRKMFVQELMTKAEAKAVLS